MNIHHWKHESMCGWLTNYTLDSALITIVLTLFLPPFMLFSSDYVQTGPYNKSYTETQLQAGGGFILPNFNEEQVSNENTSMCLWSHRYVYVTHICAINLSSSRLYSPKQYQWLVICTWSSPWLQTSPKVWSSAVNECVFDSLFSVRQLTRACSSRTSTAVPGSTCCV